MIAGPRHQRPLQSRQRREQQRDDVSAGTPGHARAEGHQDAQVSGDSEHLPLYRTQDPSLRNTRQLADNTEEYDAWELG